jgi:hypothetical protein
METQCVYEAIVARIVYTAPSECGIIGSVVEQVGRMNGYLLQSKHMYHTDWAVV